MFKTMQADLQLSEEGLTAFLDTGLTIAYFSCMLEFPIK